MLPFPSVADDLFKVVEDLSRQPLPELLARHGILHAIARDRLLESLCHQVRLPAGEERELQRHLVQTLGGSTDPWPQGDWLTALPPQLRDSAQRGLRELILPKLLEERYGPRVEARFLERRRSLERVVFRLLRLPQQGLAEELYLRLVDDGASFGDLARRHSLGEEAITRGIVGPIATGELHATLQALIGRLREGETHPPVPLDQAFLVVRLEHRLEASLHEETRRRLLQELLEADLQPAIEAAMDELLRSAAAVNGAALGAALTRSAA